MPIFLPFGQEASLALKNSVNFYFSAAVCRITAASRVSATPSPFTSALAAASASRLVSSALAARTDTLSLVVTAPSPFTSPRRRAAAIFSVRLLTAALISLCTASVLHLHCHIHSVHLLLLLPVRRSWMLRTHLYLQGLQLLFPA